MATTIIPTFSGVAAELSADTFTYPNAYSGEEFALGDRSLLFCLASGQGDITTAPSAVTYGGVGATKLAEFGAESGSGFDWYFSLWRLDSPSGNNADVVVTSAAGHNRHMFLQVLAAYNLGPFLDFGTDESLSANQLDLSLNTQVSGAVVAILGRYNNSSSAVNGTWGVNFVDDKKASQLRGPFDEIGVNWDLTTSTETPRTVTATITNPGGTLLGVGGLSVSFGMLGVDVDGALASDGVAAADFLGDALFDGDLASDGIAAASFVGDAAVEVVFAADGVAEGTFVGINEVAALSTQAVASIAWVGALVVNAAWTSEGVGFALFSGGDDGVWSSVAENSAVEWVGSALGGDNWITESPPSGTWTPEAAL